MLMVKLTKSSSSSPAEGNAVHPLVVSRVTKGAQDVLQTLVPKTLFTLDSYLFFNIFSTDRT